MPRAFVVSEVRTLAKVVAAFAVALLTLALWGSPAWAQAELTIDKIDRPDPVTEGEILTYTIEVENTAEVSDPADPDANTASDVEVVDTLVGPGLRFVSAQSAAGDCTGVDPGDIGGVVRCELGDLAPDESATVTIRVRPTGQAAQVGTVLNTACVEADNGDPASPDDCDETTTTVLPNIVIDKLDDRDPVRVGGNVLYTLRVTNEGSATIGPGDLVVIDELPIGDVRLVSVDSNFFDCDPLDPPTGRIRCESRADFGPEDTASIKITVDPDEAGTIRNTAEVRVEGVRVDRDTEETTVKADAEETTAEETTDEETTDEETTDEQTTDQKTTDEQTTVIDGQTILIPDKLADTTLPETGGPSGIALAAGCALLGVGLIINRIFR